MPAALLECPAAAHVETPDAPSEPFKASVAALTCSGCYLSEAELRRTGLLGCARCYETFAAVIAPAVSAIHGVRVPQEWHRPKPARAVTNPWPTRRGVQIVRSEAGIRVGDGEP